AIDLDKKISWLNAEACKQFNLAHEKAVGKPFTEVFISYPEIYSLLDNDTPFKTTLDISPTQDEQIHYDCFLESIQNQRGEPIGKSLEIRDVTGRMELMRQINLLSTTDPTTGIFNRRHFLEIIQKEINRIQRKQQSAAFFLMDIDDFKIINDSFGHQTGDELLKAISATLKKQIRNYDILGRYAGDEFVLFMPEISKDDLSRTANRLLNKVRDTTIQYQKQDVSVTISIGVLYIEAAEKVNMVQIIQRADQALYNAKRTGKNDFAIWNQEIEDSNFFVPQS
ncbi:MAG: diguanylate cyclase, partial [Anaerolineaceae bacterium]|nr:diguanylate cyclase [Anaerolineaceae bacterium]